MVINLGNMKLIIVEPHNYVLAHYLQKNSKKRLKAKGALPKISVGKISNKRLNKLAKQGKLKKSLPKRKFINLLKKRTGVQERAPGLQTYPG